MRDKNQPPTPEQLLRKIAGRLAGIHWHDLTTVERQVATLLITNKYLTFDDNENLIEKGN